MSARAAHLARIALITGAGSGIGAALARQLAAPGIALALQRAAPTKQRASGLAKSPPVAPRRAPNA